MNPLSMLEMMVKQIDTEPTLSQMPTKTLIDKGINGPTSAHTIEQIHTPLNLAYVTFSTGSTAFQNIIGVTWQELPNRVLAGRKALQLSGLQNTNKLLITYPPLVNVFGLEAFKKEGIEHDFLYRSNRDACLLALCQQPYNAILGESSFLRATLEQAIKLELTPYLPKSLVILAAGSPLDLELLTLTEKLGYKVYDLYGNQEFGWLTINGLSLRDDLSLVPAFNQQGFVEVIVGGLPTGDSFPIPKENSHLLSVPKQLNTITLATYKRVRSETEYEVIVTATKYKTKEILERTAKTILRIKGRIVKISDNLKLNSDSTELLLLPSSILSKPYLSIAPIVIAGEQKTELFDNLLEAQAIFQSHAKSDATWLKKR